MANPTLGSYLDAFFQMKLGVYNAGSLIQVAQSANFSSDFLATWNSLTQQVDISINPASTAAGTVAATPNRLLLRNGSGEGFLNGLDTPSVSTTGAVLSLSAGTKIQLQCQFEANNHSLTKVSMMTASQGTGWSFTQPNATAAPNAAAWHGQDAGAGAYDGGAITWTTGAPGGAANKGGDFTIDLNALDSGGNGATLRIANAAVDFLQISQINNGPQYTLLYSVLPVQMGGNDGTSWTQYDSVGTRISFTSGKVFQVVKDGSASQLSADGTGISVDANYLDLPTEIATPATPGTGARLYANSTTHYPTAKLADGTALSVSLSAYGEMHVHNGGASQTLTTAGTYYKVTQWDTADVNAGVTLSTLNSTMTVTYAGVYKVDVSMSYVGVANTTYTAAVYVGGVADSGSYATTKTNANGDTKVFPMTCLLNLAAGAVVDVRVTADANGATFAVTNGNMNIHKC